MYSKYDRANIENAKNLKTGFKNSVEEVRPRFVPKMKINGERIVAKRPPVVHNQVYAEVNELLDLTASAQSPSSYEAMQPHEPSPYPSCDQSEQYLFLEIPYELKLSRELLMRVKVVLLRYLILRNTTLLRCQEVSYSLMEQRVG